MFYSVTWELGYNLKIINDLKCQSNIFVDATVLGTRKLTWSSLDLSSQLELSSSNQPRLLQWDPTWSIWPDRLTSLHETPLTLIYLSPNGPQITSASWPRIWLDPTVLGTRKLTRSRLLFISIRPPFNPNSLTKIHNTKTVQGLRQLTPSWSNLPPNFDRNSA